MHLSYLLSSQPLLHMLLTLLPYSSLPTRIPLNLTILTAIPISPSLTNIYLSTTLFIPLQALMLQSVTPNYHNPHPHPTLISPPYPLHPNILSHAPSQRSLRPHLVLTLFHVLFIHPPPPITQRQTNHVVRFAVKDVVLLLPTSTIRSPHLPRLLPSHLLPQKIAMTRSLLPRTP